MFGVQNKLAPANVQKIILTLLDVHSYKTGSVAKYFWIYVTPVNV